MYGSKYLWEYIGEKIIKHALHTFKKAYGGDEKRKKVKLSALRWHYEILKMNKHKMMVEFLTRLVVVTNKMKVWGEAVSELMKAEKVLRTLTPCLDYIACSI